MPHKAILALGSAALALSGVAAVQAAINSPLTIENCGQSATFEHAPQNAVAPIVSRTTQLPKP
ncbi:hypothetical protein [Celeribacter baekdonensis]|jgi:iron complex transport system substrate-binding protein|uniref:hypothetical protein n=1 Tax=Celeribacter baekdonensis TaxID=875171 RepID=UPI0030D99774|tara:strand:- start:209 stop:397 length:189 start_codon:yes stop_codon:yes gene_type:complete